MEPTQNGPLCRRCFQTHFLLPACQILPGPFLGKMVGIGTVYCISYWATHCHYNLITYNMYKNVFEENSEKCTAQSRVKDSFRGCRPAPGANSWFPHVVMSTWTPQPRAFTIKCRVNLAVANTAKLTGPRTFTGKNWVGPVKLFCIIMYNINKIRPKSPFGPVKAPKFSRCLLWSPILVSGLVVVLLSSLTASEYWKKKKKRMVGNPLRIKPITIKIHWCATKAACNPVRGMY